MSTPPPRSAETFAVVMYRPALQVSVGVQAGVTGGENKDGASASGGTKLVIVESPAKAKTIGGYLGKGYVVEASIGHIRDLPRNAADVPPKYKGEAWARLGVDTEHGEPLYVVALITKQQVTKLKNLLKDADRLYLATDEDRGGEAIAWHLVETLNPKIPVRRMVFHEILPGADRRSPSPDPRDIDANLVDAQETRRILDRLYGWGDVAGSLEARLQGAPQAQSAGRVQSVATRIIVQREGVSGCAFPSAKNIGMSTVSSPRRTPKNPARPRDLQRDPHRDRARRPPPTDPRDFDPATGALEVRRPFTWKSEVVVLVPRACRRDSTACATPPSRSSRVEEVAYRRAAPTHPVHDLDASARGSGRKVPLVERGARCRSRSGV